MFFEPSRPVTNGAMGYIYNDPSARSVREQVKNGCQTIGRQPETDL